MNSYGNVPARPVGTTAPVGYDLSAAAVRAARRSGSGRNDYGFLTRCAAGVLCLSDVAASVRTKQVATLLPDRARLTLAPPRRFPPIGPAETGLDVGRLTTADRELRPVRWRRGLTWATSASSAKSAAAGWALFTRRSNSRSVGGSRSRCSRLPRSTTAPDSGSGTRRTRSRCAGDLTGTGEMLGTLLYMSPEQVAGGADIDPRTDVYSLGATPYELLTLRPAFPGSDPHDVLRRVASGEPAGKERREFRTPAGTLLAAAFSPDAPLRLGPRPDRPGSRPEDRCRHRLGRSRHDHRAGVGSAVPRPGGDRSCRPQPGRDRPCRPGPDRKGPFGTLAGFIWVVDLATGRERHRLAHTGVTAVAFDPRGGRIASAGGDGDVRVWDAHTGEVVQRLQGHSRGTGCVAYNPSGTRLACGGRDGTCRIWDTATGEAVQTLRRGTGGMVGGAFTPTARGWRPCRPGRCRCGIR